MSTNRHRLAALFGAATLTALAVGTPATAHADSASFADRADASASPTDIRNVQVTHSASRVSVVTRFTDLRRGTEATSSARMMIDTQPERAGAEYAFMTGLQEGTDYSLLRVRNGKPVGEPLTCEHFAKLNFAKNTLRFGTDRGCLGNPESVRVSLKMLDETDASHRVVDWLGTPRSFSDWVTSA